jgi:hypothetical protein
MAGPCIPRSTGKYGDYTPSWITPAIAFPIGVVVLPILILIVRAVYLNQYPPLDTPKPQHYVGQLYTLEPEGTAVKVLSIYKYDADAENWRYLVRYKGQLIEAYERELRSTSAEAVSQRKRVEQ